MITKPSLRETNTIKCLPPSGFCWQLLLTGPTCVCLAGTGTVLHQVDPGVACAATVCIILLSLGMAHFLDSKRRRNLPPRAGWQDAHRVGWCSPDALLSLHISPITRVRNSPSPTTGSRLSM